MIPNEPKPHLPRRTQARRSPSARWAARSAAILVLFASVAGAAPPPEAPRLMKSRDAERYEKDAPNSSIKAGGARISVRAPVERVVDVVTDYRHYGEFIKRFDKVKVVGRDGDKTDVYLQVPILKGAAKIWGVVRFEPPRGPAGDRVVKGRMLKGNVERLEATWRVRKIDDKNTQLHLELLIVPKLPIPDSLVTDEAAYASDVSVTGARDRAEQRAAKKK